MNKEIVKDSSALARRAAEIFVDAARAAVATHGRFSVALSGGSTPRKLYELLATTEFRAQIEWQKTHFFFGDERNVSPDDAESNFGMTRETLFSRVPEIPSENIHRVRAELAAHDAASHYECELKDFFKHELPRFDLILLGLGADGHTASLFPSSPALRENQRWFVENWVEKLAAYRLTLTFPVLNNARQIVFLVSGADKAAIIREIFQNTETKYPAQQIKLTNGNLLWLFDEQASSKLKP
jgi:6-phosphogluconolactonase